MREQCVSQTFVFCHRKSTYEGQSQSPGRGSRLGGPIPSGRGSLHLKHS